MVILHNPVEKPVRNVENRGKNCDLTLEDCCKTDFLYSYKQCFLPEVLTLVICYPCSMGELQCDADSV